MTLDFFLPKNVLQKKITICLKYQNKTVYFKTNILINQDQWDQEKQRPLNIYLKKFKIVNNQLNEIILQVNDYFKVKNKENKYISKKDLSKIIKSICSDRREVITKNSLLYYMNMYIESKKEIICHSTFKRYKVFLNLLRRFEGFLKTRIYIDTIDNEFISSFIKFGKEELYSLNTIYRTLHFVKTILNFLERKGISTNVRELDIKREKQQKFMVTLTENEISIIKSLNVPNNLQNAKDWLIISCYTGQRFSDFIQFDTKNLININGIKCIRFVQQKTKKDILLPLHPLVLNIVESNNNQFPKLLNIQDYNTDIKQISKLANLNEIIKSRKRIGNRTKELEIQKWEFISSHIGRRSFVSNFYGKIPTSLLMEATGHSSESIFRKYINPINNDNIIKLNNYFEEIYLRKQY